MADTLFEKGTNYNSIDENRQEKDRISNQIWNQLWEIIATQANILNDRLHLMHDKVIAGEFTEIAPIDSETGIVPDSYLPLYVPAEDGLVPLRYLPDITKQPLKIVSTETAKDEIDTTDFIAGTKCFVRNTHRTYMWDGTVWELLSDKDWANIELQWNELIDPPTDHDGQSLKGKQVPTWTHAKDYTDQEIDTLETEFNDKLATGYKENNIDGGRADSVYGVHDLAIDCGDASTNI